MNIIGIMLMFFSFSISALTPSKTTILYDTLSRTIVEVPGTVCRLDMHKIRDVKFFTEKIEEIRNRKRSIFVKIIELFSYSATLNGEKDGLFENQTVRVWVWFNRIHVKDTIFFGIAWLSGLFAKNAYYLATDIETKQKRFAEIKNQTVLEALKKIKKKKITKTNGTQVECEDCELDPITIENWSAVETAAKQEFPPKQIDPTKLKG